MEQTEELLEKIKANNSQINKEVLKDIIAIDGAIVQEESLNYKEKIYKNMENKYSVKLDEMKYYIFQEKLDKKLDEYVESNKKDINTNLGLLKLFLIRIAAIEDVNGKEIEEIVKTISSEESYLKIKDLYENLDKQLLKSL